VIDSPQSSSHLRILIIKTRSIGDNIAMFPALKLLRERFAHAVIEVLTTTRAAAPLTNLPTIDAVHCLEKHAGMLKRIHETLRVMRAIRRRHFDLAINLQASSGSEVLTLLSGARMRLIYPYAYGRKSRFSHFEIGKPREVRHAVREDIDALKPLGITSCTVAFEYPLDTRIREKAERILRECGVDARGYIVLHPGAGECEKVWSSAHFGALADMIKKELGLRSVVVFEDRERSLFEEIAAASSASPHGLTLSFDLLAGIIEKCLAFVGSDSSPHHVACMLDVPSIVLMPRDRRATWHPYDTAHHRVLRGDSHPGTGRSIDRITPDEVFAELKSLVRSVHRPREAHRSCGG
jgi:ADP-heptose:LPS heptosyltransferase